MPGKKMKNEAVRSKMKKNEKERKREKEKGKVNICFVDNCILT